jgi:hypothetical protein
MHFTHWFTSALLLLAEADVISAKAIMHLPSGMRRRGHSSDRLLRREPQSPSSSPLSISQPTTAMNSTITTACNDGLSSIKSVQNDAGLTACYNIVQYDAEQGAFQADLRLYQTFDPKGSFSNVSVNDIQISLTYPASTMFQSLTKRKRDVLQRQSSMQEIQQYLLFGTFEKDLDLNKLNETQVMSLMLPEIKLNSADDTGKPVMANISATDGAWFVAGQFRGSFKEGLITPTTATAAIAVAVPFVLPGTSLGIFPTGLIITCAWTLMFFLAYGFGTFGRIRYRDVYRRRKSVQAGRRGKKI